MSRWLASGNGLRGFLGWWGNGLAAWLPARMRQALAARGDRLLLQPQGEAMALSRQHESQVHALASLPLPLPAGSDALAGVLRESAADLPRWLLLPASLGLRRSLPLPAAARERLRDVLGFEIERQTPFSLADVLYDGRVLAVREDGQLQVELVVVPRPRFDAAVAQLGGSAGALAGVDLADAEGQALGVNLLPPEQRRQQRDPWRVWNLVLALAAVLALVLGMAQLLDNRRAAADALQADMAKRETQARGINAQRQQLIDAVEGGAYLGAQHNGRPSAVEIMNTLSQRIPDGAWLEKLAIDGDQLTLIGLSNQAAALVGKLEGAPQWRTPALSGALQQDPRSRMDRFTLIAQLAGTPAAAKSKEVPDGPR